VKHTVANIGENLLANYLQNFIQLPLIVYSAFDKYLRKKWKYNEAVLQVFREFEKACDSIKIEV
jgi:hypothetical protein